MLFGCHRFNRWSDSEQNSQIHLNMRKWRRTLKPAAALIIHNICISSFVCCCPALTLAVTLTCLQDTNIKALYEGKRKKKKHFITTVSDREHQRGAEYLCWNAKAFNSIRRTTFLAIIEFLCDSRDDLGGSMVDDHSVSPHNQHTRGGM